MINRLLLWVILLALFYIGYALSGRARRPLSDKMLQMAKTNLAKARLLQRARLRCGDAAHLPFTDGIMNVHEPHVKPVQKPSVGF